MQDYQIVHDYSTVIDQEGILRFKGYGVPLQQIQQTIDQLLTTAIEKPINISQSFQLLENFPNPFNPSTTLQFVLPKAQQIELQIFDSRGRLVRQLANGTYPAGQHHVVWDGRNEAQIEQPSGAYFYRLSANGQQLTKKMLLMK